MPRGTLDGFPGMHPVDLDLHLRLTHNACMSAKVLLAGKVGISGKLTIAKMVRDILVDNTARMVDVAPTEMTVLQEDTDWMAVGGDFAEALEEIASDDPAVRAIVQPPDEELVEA